MLPKCSRSKQVTITFSRRPYNRQTWRWLMQRPQLLSDLHWWPWDPRHLLLRSTSNPRTQVHSEHMYPISALYRASVGIYRDGCLINGLVVLSWASWICVRVCGCSKMSEILNCFRYTEASVYLFFYLSIYSSISAYLYLQSVPPVSLSAHFHSPLIKLRRYLWAWTASRILKRIEITMPTNTDLATVFLPVRSLTRLIENLALGLAK